MILLLVSLMQSGSGRADEPDLKLQNNPFRHPDITQTANDSSKPKSPAVETEERLELRATLTLGRRSLANVAGKIIGIGEEIDGFRLLAVAEGSAVFVKNGIQRNVSVIDDAEGGRND
jgi:hypothetical protein